MTNGNGNAIDWLKEKLGLGPPPTVYVPPYRPPVVVRPPVPIAIPPNAPSAIVAEPTVAGLVSTHNHSKGRAMDTGSLVGGR